MHTAFSNPTRRPWPPLWFGDHGHRPRHAVVIDRASLALGWAALLTIWVFPFAASALIVPPWAVLVVHGLWLAHAGLAVKLTRRHPRVVPLVVLQALMVWYSFVTLGGVLLGWGP